MSFFHQAYVSSFLLLQLLLLPGTHISRGRVSKTSKARRKSFVVHRNHKSCNSDRGCQNLFVLRIRCCHVRTNIISSSSSPSTSLKGAKKGDHRRDHEQTELQQTTTAAPLCSICILFLQQ